MMENNGFNNTNGGSMADLEELRKKMLEDAKKGIKEQYASEEYALIQAINAYLQLSKSYNLLFERLSEWFGIYIPELSIQNPKQLIAVSIAVAEGKNIQDAASRVIGSNPNTEGILEKINSTIGRPWNDEEKNTFLQVARLGAQIESTLDSLDAYINSAANRLMPNVTYLSDPKIAAELLSKAGSLERMAFMPASTIQLLGAEKALFRHIKFGSKSPKYGVFFKLPKVSGGRWDIRGKIARLYATKISIAVKADYFSKRFIAKELKESLDAGIKRIESEPERKREERGRFGRGGGNINRPNNRRNSKFKGFKRKRY